MEILKVFQDLPFQHAGHTAAPKNEISMCFFHKLSYVRMQMSPPIIGSRCGTRVLTKRGGVFSGFRFMESCEFVQAPEGLEVKLFKTGEKGENIEVRSTGAKNCSFATGAALATDVWSKQQLGPGRAAATRSGGGGDLPSPNPLDGFRFGALNPVLTDQGLHGLLGAFRCLISWSLSLHWRAWRAPTFLGVRDHLSPFQGVRSGTLTVRDIQGLRGGVRVCVYLTPVARDTILQFYSILLYIAPQEGSGPLSLTAQRRQ